MKSKTRALNSPPAASTLEQQVTMLIRFRCRALRSVSHSDRNVLDAPTCRRSNTFTATATASCAAAGFFFALLRKSVPRYTEPNFPAPTRLASAKPSVALASSA
jgi:hypothetical protein